jgi:glucokinase
MTNRPVVLGLDFGGTKIAAAVCDLAGDRLAATRVDSVPDDGAEAAMARATAAARELLGSVGSSAELRAVGAATFGIPYDDRVDLAPAIADWEQLPFGRRITDAFPGVPVRLATDVKAAAQAEVRWGSLAGCDPALYVNLGTGLATAIVVGGQVVAGAHAAAGEIGYNIRTVADVGRGLDRSMLEDAVSGKALAARSLDELGHDLSAAELFEFAERDDRAAALVDDFARELALHVVNLAVAVDPARICVGGGMVRSWHRLAPVLRAALDAAVPFPPELVVAEFPFDAPLIGAVALAVEAARESQHGDGRAFAYAGAGTTAGQQSQEGDQFNPAQLNTAPLSTAQ